LNVEHRLRAFENTMLRKIYGPAREKLTAEWRRRLHIEELYDLYASPDIIRVIKYRRLDGRGM
jgi:hypothetical protein